MAALLEEGLIIKGSYGKVFRRNGDHILEWIGQRFPGVAVRVKSPLPYTLNEDKYLSEIYEDITLGDDERREPRPYYVPKHLRQRLHLLERDFELTEEELLWLGERLLDAMFTGGINYRVFLRLETLRNHIGRDNWPFYQAFWGPEDDEQPNIREWYRRWFEITEEDSRAMGYGEPFKPLASELSIILDRYRQNRHLPTRAQEIQNALATPRWLEEWPE
jgi:hypothetical protein